MREKIIWPIVYFLLFAVPVAFITYFGFFNKEDVWVKVYPHLKGEYIKNSKVFVVYKRNIVFHGIAHGENGNYIHFRRLKGTSYIIHVENDTIFFPNKKWGQPGTTLVYVKGVRMHYRAR